MSVSRINEFRAKEEKADALRAFLTRIVPTGSPTRVTTPLDTGWRMPTWR